MQSGGAQIKTLQGSTCVVLFKGLIYTSSMMVALMLTNIDVGLCETNDVRYSWRPICKTVFKFQSILIIL